MDDISRPEILLNHTNNNFNTTFNGTGNDNFQIPSPSNYKMPNETTQIDSNLLHDKDSV
mgnify:CR=1 FL=1